MVFTHSSVDVCVGVLCTLEHDTSGAVGAKLLVGQHSEAVGPSGWRQLSVSVH